MVAGEMMAMRGLMLQNNVDKSIAEEKSSRADAAAAALKRLLDDPDERLRLGRDARAHTEAFFAPEAWIAALPSSVKQSMQP